MKKTLQFFIALMICYSGFSQSLWQSVSSDKLRGIETFERASTPLVYSLYSLNLDNLKEELSGAPLRNTGVASSVMVEFPIGGNAFETFKVYAAPVVAEGLSSRYSGLDSYVGQSVDNPLNSVRFSVTVFGLHAMFFTEDGVSYMDTYTKDLNYYMLYEKKDLVDRDRNFICESVSEEDILFSGKGFDIDGVTMPEMDDSTFRTYRLAMACTIEYAAYHVAQAGVESGTLAQKKAAVLAAMVVTMTRVDGIYERDMAVTMELVANNDAVIFIDSDNFDNNNANLLINQSQTVITSNIGFANFDIGHTVSTGGGGLAGLGVVCSNGNKARGITGSPAPVGDAYDVDYVAHEMGHQFGATHTFNNSCSGNRSPSTAVEPGSGSTIMGYAGICSPNVQNNSDAHFHAVSIQQMKNLVLSSAVCSVNTPNGNNAPVVNAGSNYLIPLGTPFVLTASATDADGDSLTYCWEQLDNEISTQPPLNTSISGPNYRSKSPTTSPSRYLPSLEDVLNNNLVPTWEVTPSVGRSMDFSCTVRDNELIDGGQTGRDDMVVTVSNTVGPFDVTSQGTAGVQWAQGETRTITWDVNNANTLVGSANVDILLSLDGGLTFTETLAAATPNDGSQDIIVPNVAAPFCRVMVKPTGNIYYDVNTTDFSIGFTVTETCYTYTNSTPVSIPDGQGNSGWVFRTVDVPEDFTISDVNVTADVTHTYIQDLVLILVDPDFNQVVLWAQNCADQDGFNVVFDDAAPAIPSVCANPLLGTYAPLGDLSDLNGLQSPGTWQIAVSDWYPTDSGQLNSWSLELCGTTAVAGNESFSSLSNFNVYPNPNNGTFTIDLNSNSDDDITLEVFDVRGRSVFNNVYSNTGNFTQTINLNTVSRGVYLLNVSDGVSKETKKLVIQ